MDHLDVMTGAVRTHIGAAGCAVDRDRHLGDHGRDALPRRFGATRHDRGAFERSFLAAGHAHADEQQLLLRQRLFAPARIGKQRIAGIDDDVAFIQMRHQLGDDVVGRLASLDHNNDCTRLRQRGDEILDRMGRHELALVTMIGDQLVGLFWRAIMYGDAEAFARRIAGQVGAHNRKAGDTNIG